MAVKKPKSRPKGNVTVQVGRADRSQIVAGENVQATLGPRLDVHLDKPERKRTSGGRPGGKRKSPPRRSRKAAPPPEQIYLFKTLRERFNLEELETICWELGIAFDDLPARTLTGKARQLVERAAALNLLDQLSAIVRRERPEAA
ncbi:MAG: hypothetical protein RMN25_02700 [Anaerolineae bacterium]|nr:hypothetical protein [Thermoflexales bacterium]MDW8406666.1 hypothetical protein [Anaerolineae bacterium]